MITKAIDLIEYIFDFADTNKGMFFFASALATFFIIYTLNNPVGMFPLGSYFFGVVCSFSLYLRAALLTKQTKTKVFILVIAVAYLSWAVIDFMLRRS